MANLRDQPCNATPLPRFDGRSVALQDVALPEPRPVRMGTRGKLVLRYWKPGTPFRDVSLAALELALDRARESVVAFLCHPNGDARLQRSLRRVDPSLSLVSTSEISRLDSGGGRQLTSLIRKHHASVVVVDNLSKLMPRIHWLSPQSRFEEAERETLREIRSILPGFDRHIELVLFHFLDRDKAGMLLEEGLVDETQDLRL